MHLHPTIRSWVFFVFFMEKPIYIKSVNLGLLCCFDYNLRYYEYIKANLKGNLK